MNQPIKIKINVTKVLKEYIFEGKSGKYLNLVAWPNKSGTGQYGDTHFVVQDIPRDVRESGMKSPIVGNLTIPESEQREERAPPPARAVRTTTRKPPPGTIEHPAIVPDDGDDEIPF